MTEQELDEWRYTIALLHGGEFYQSDHGGWCYKGGPTGRLWEMDRREYAVLNYLRRNKLPTEPLP